MLRGKMLESGFYSDQVWGGLKKGWIAYVISCKHDDWDRRLYYAAVINKLEKDLGIKQYEFEEIQELAAEFLDEHGSDPDIQDMSLEEIKELMRKSDIEFWQSVRGEE